MGRIAADEAAGDERAEEFALAVDAAPATDGEIETAGDGG